MRLLLLLLLASCATTGPRPGSDWRCWQRDPLEPNLPQGDVLFVKERMTGGHLELQSLLEQNGQRSATRFSFAQVEDHLETTLEGTTMIVRLDSSGWTMHSSSGGLESIEVVRIEDGKRTVTAIDQDPKGAPTNTTVHYGPADCAVVDRELARLP